MKCRFTLALPTALALLAAACSDAPTGPAAARTENVLSTQVASPNPSASRQGASPYACFTSVATPGGTNPWTYGRLDLHFPKTALASDGATMRYHYRRYTPEGTLLRLANCVIPRTEEAVILVQRRLSVPGGVAMGSAKRSGTGEVGTLDTEYCQYENGVCTFKQIDGYSQPQPSPCETPGCSPGSGSGGSWGNGGYDTGGGSGPCTGCEPDAPVYDAEEDRSGEWDGTGDRLDCPRPGTGFTSERCDKIAAAIQSLKDHPDLECKTLGNSAEDRFYTKKEFFLWKSPYSTDYGAAGTLGQTGLTDRAFTPGQLANTIAHEEAHHGLNGVKYSDKWGRREDGSRYYIPPASDGRYAHDFGQKCANSTL